MTNYESEDDNLYLIIGEIDDENPTYLESGSFMKVGNLNIVTLTEQDENGGAVCRTRGVYNLPVTNADENNDPIAVAVGDVVYINNGVLNFDATDGFAFGHVLDTMSEGVAPVEQTLRVVIGQFIPNP